MQLKLRVGLTDTLTIDVQETDTFQDLSDRLYRLGGVSVDLSQLQKSHDKPFDMSTNVIGYFIPNGVREEEEEALPEEDTLQKEEPEPMEEEEEEGNVDGRPYRLCRLCSNVIPTNPCYLFEDKNDSEDKITLVQKVNSALPICVTKQDHLPKQICESCFAKVNKGFDFVRKVVDAQNALQQVYNIKPKDRPVTNFKEEGCCPLCSTGRFKPLNHRERQAAGSESYSGRLGPKKDSHGRQMLGDKQLVTPLRERLPPAQARQLSANPQPIKVKDEPVEFGDYYTEDNSSILSGYWDQDGNFNPRRKKRPKHDDDQDWTIDEEYVPVSRRGRPRGTKNKPKIKVPVIEKKCVLCNWSGPDIDFYAHSICQHCQPDMGYFPCPFCRAHMENEMELETHIDEHNAETRKER